MKVKELKVLLETFPDDYEIIIQKDGEGNDYSPLSECESDYYYVPENTWSGYILHNTDINDLFFDTEEEREECLSHIRQCIVLSPIN